MSDRIGPGAGMGDGGSVASLLGSRLLLVTGKGGTGKTSFSAALALLGAVKGRRTLLCEVDTQRPSMAAIFGHPPGPRPEEVLPNLDLVNVHWDVAIADYMERYVPARRLVARILKNRVVRRFLDFAPGGRELFILSRLTDLAADYELMVVDMQASGHAFSMLDITRSALGVFRTGPMVKRVREMIDTLRAPDTRMVFVSLPEEMVVNETLETRERMERGNLIGGPPAVFLNRATLPSLTDEERALIGRLAEQDLEPLAREFVRAGFWEDTLEQATAAACERLAEVFPEPPVLIPPAGAGGVPRLVVARIAVHLGRMVGVTRRELPWI